MDRWSAQPLTSTILLASSMANAGHLVNLGGQLGWGNSFPCSSQSRPGGIAPQGLGVHMISLPWRVVQTRLSSSVEPLAFLLTSLLFIIS